MDMKKFKIPEGLERYMETVLEMYGLPHQMTENAVLLPEDITDEEFGEILDDVLCEQERVENHSTLPVITYKTMLNEEKLKKVMAYYGQAGGNSDSYAFHITKQPANKKSREI
ncbi:MAG: hypothetical protein LUG99_18680 [Lachnospiraceae bacterium]|nr:hypothetical protein [Lachnospiraceae bacterium]